MSASAEMPYFIKPSINMDTAAKKAAYEQAILEIDEILAGETNMILKMVSINCLLKTNLTYYYWVGFYLVSGERKLSVGPYQGTMGCLHIDFSQGVCGRAAREEKTQIVADCHALEQGTAHIACDPNSQSEIVLPVFNEKRELMAVFDVDSSLKGSFDEVDKDYLEGILERHFSYVKSQKDAIIGYDVEGKPLHASQAKKQYETDLKAVEEGEFIIAKDLRKASKK